MSVHYRVLVVDNERSSLSRYRNMSVWLENGFEISASASSRNEAVRAAARTDPDLIICCNKPPMIVASALMKELLKVRAETAFIIISPHADTENMRECFLLGAIDYLTEPVAEGRLRDALRRAKEHLDKTSSNYEYARTVEEYFAELELPDDKFIEELKEFILDCENMTATTEYAADHFRYNKDYFGRMFKAKLGMTFGDFYKRFRIKYAEKLLLSGRYKVYEVSEILGFASVDYFSSVFKKIIGKRPSELKRY
ncbi:MAG: helix-turn-helix domain-containing protein [Ruminococcus sp.]|nr:helix-turn-helix domain-containing protein [Ruminococcus sp.]